MRSQYVMQYVHWKQLLQCEHCNMLLKAEALTVTGSYAPLECGVWRGGMSIFAATLRKSGLRQPPV